MSLLEISSVTKRFGGFTAVDKVSLEVNKGDIKFLIGPNGAGKSTLFKMIIGVHSLNSGDVLFNGKKIEKLSLSERINLGMGVKFQAPSVFNELTIKELAGDLSHGKKQWLDIAMCSISEPELIFLDEPTAGLSYEETKKTGEIVKSLNEKGITFVIVEHNMDILKQIAKSVAVLHLGKLFFEGTAKEVLSNNQVMNIYLGIS